MCHEGQIIIRKFLRKFINWKNMKLWCLEQGRLQIHNKNTKDRCKLFIIREGNMLGGMCCTHPHTPLPWNPLSKPPHGHLSPCKIILGTSTNMLQSQSLWTSPWSWSSTSYWPNSNRINFHEVSSMPVWLEVVLMNCADANMPSFSLTELTLGQPSGISCFYGGRYQLPEASINLPLRVDWSSCHTSIQ